MLPSIQLAKELSEIDDKYKIIANRLTTLYKEEDEREYIQRFGDKKSVQEIIENTENKKDDFNIWLKALQKYALKQPDEKRWIKMESESIFRTLLLDFQFIYNEVENLLKEKELITRERDKLLKVIVDHIKEKPKEEKKVVEEPKKEEVIDDTI
jgi:hypothetical protein